MYEPTVLEIEHEDGISARQDGLLRKGPVTGQQTGVCSQLACSGLILRRFYLEDLTLGFIPDLDHPPLVPPPFHIKIHQISLLHLLPHPKLHLSRLKNLKSCFILFRLMGSEPPHAHSSQYIFQHF